MKKPICKLVCCSARDGLDMKVIKFKSLKTGKTRYKMVVNDKVIVKAATAETIMFEMSEYMGDSW